MPAEYEEAVVCQWIYISTLEERYDKANGRKTDLVHHAWIIQRGRAPGHPRDSQVARVIIYQTRAIIGHGSTSLDIWSFG